MRGKILCVEPDPALLESRCAVLKYSGYDAASASPRVAEIVLSSQKFDLIVISRLPTSIRTESSIWLMARMCWFSRRSPGRQSCFLWWHNDCNGERSGQKRGLNRVRHLLAADPLPESCCHCQCCRNTPALL